MLSVLSLDYFSEYIMFKIQNVNKLKTDSSKTQCMHVFVGYANNIMQMGFGYFGKLHLLANPFGVTFTK